VYELIDGKQHCSRHGVMFGRAESCAACVDDPGPPPDEVADEPEAPPTGCMSSVDVERSFGVIAEHALVMIRKLVAKTPKGRATRKAIAGLPPAADLGVVDTHLANSYVKLGELYLKARSRQYDCAARREDEAIVRRREREKREHERGTAH
jgi:hypothetical protein